MPRKKGSAKPASPDAVSTYKHTAKRKNIPLAGLESNWKIEESQKLRYEYNPHLPPVLRIADDAPSADALPELLTKAATQPLDRDELDLLTAALRRHEPWLEWSGKREKPWFEVDPVALHIHERVSTQAILRVLAREDVQRDLFADPQQDYAKAVQFYRHDVDWSNRMILGDSLAVMASLARREDLAGKVQMIYVDPPYGIKFASNFQPQLGQRDVKDKESDLTREPEMVRAYRDTWTLGVHSYLAYLRDRLAMAKELLADSGSIFIQISDDNLHRVRCMMDEVFGPHNYVAVINVTKTSGQTAKHIAVNTDYLLWYAKDIENAKCRPLLLEKSPDGLGGSMYQFVEFHDGSSARVGDTVGHDDGELFRLGDITSQRQGRPSGPGSAMYFPVPFQGREFLPPGDRGWTTTAEGMSRLAKAERIKAQGNRLAYVRYFRDYRAVDLGNNWLDTAGVPDRCYVVQTNTKIVERCLLMTTDPGDLVFDPTCGSGTTAFVAEQWGRRWITTDTSRVALALARQRLMTARFPAYRLRELTPADQERNPHGHWIAEVDADGKPTGKRLTIQCKAVSHVTLGSIARNTSLDPIFAKHEPILAERLATLNAALAKHASADLRDRLADKLRHKERTEGKRAITDADRRRWILPKDKWEEWEAPFDTDPDWPKPLTDALTAFRTAWRAKMDEVNNCIEANDEAEELRDSPDEDRSFVRVAGPFTMEGVIAVEDGPDSPIGGAPAEELETFGDASEPSLQVQNAEAHLDKMLRLLKAAGVDFSGGKRMTFTRLEPVSSASLIHAEGEWLNGDNKTRRVAASIGPEVGNLSAWQVEQAVRTANRNGYDDVVFAAFAFDAAAQGAIQEASHPSLRLHMALIRPDVVMDDLLKTQPGSQIFTVFAAPRVAPPKKDRDGQWTIAVEGMDIYDPLSGALLETPQKHIAAWFLDTDYDGRTFCICQAFFPDKSKWAKLAKALGDVGAVDEDRFAALSGLKSLPFPRPAREFKPGEKWRVAVKIIDPRGHEGLRVVEMS